MVRQSIWLGLLVLLITTSIPRSNGMKEQMESDVKEYMIMEDYCGMDEFEELNFYLFCDTQLHEGAGGFTFKPSIISSETKTIKEAKQLYQEFMEGLPLEPKQEDGKGGVAYFSYVSPDCKWVIIDKWNKFRTIKTQILFCEKEKVRKKVNEVMVEDHPI